MTLLALLVSLGVLTAACACDTATTTEPARSEHLGTSGSTRATPSPNNETAEDRSIRRDLHRALTADADLRGRDINFTVSNGDINVTGTVNNEAERQRINDIAMAIPGVKSVANGLRVAQ